MLAHRTPVQIADGEDAESQLRQVFAEHIADHQEGLVLKAEESRYNDWKLPWVKVRVQAFDSSSIIIYW